MVFGKPEENDGLALASDTEAYAGHLGKGRVLTQRSLDSAIRADSKEMGAIRRENSALREAAFGNLAQAKPKAEKGLKLVPSSQAVEVEAALAHAMAGNTPRAESLAQDLNKRYPLGTQVQSLWLPAIRAQVALNHKDAALAITALQPASPPIEYGLDPVSKQSLLPRAPTFAAKHIWRQGRARKPLPSSRRFSTTAASCGTAGRERWRI